MKFKDIYKLYRNEGEMEKSSLTANGNCLRQIILLL
jgi:hypothetical protein